MGIFNRNSDKDKHINSESDVDTLFDNKDYKSDVYTKLDIDTPFDKETS